MYTPAKEKISRRLMTTAYTEQNISRIQLHKSDKMNQSLEQQQKMINLNRRLKFQKLQESRLYFDKSKPTSRTNTVKIKADYRKNILDYLNSRFQQVYSREKEQKKFLATTKQPQKTTSSLHQVEYPQIKIIFNSYMGAVRQFRVKIMSEYFLALILKQTNFLNNMLQERQIVSLIWKDLSQPNIGQLFIFISVLYFHLNNKFRLSHKSQLVTYAQQLFNDLGFKFNLQSLSKAFERSIKILEDRTVKLSLLNNRQNRHTASSLSRHKKRI